MTSPPAPGVKDKLPPRDPRGGRPTQSVAARLGEHILATALDQFARHAVDAISMDDLAAAANVSKRTLYARFGSKADLMVATIEYGTAKHLRPLAGTIPGDTALDQLLNAAAGMLEISLRPEAVGIEKLVAWIASRQPNLLESADARSVKMAIIVFQDILEAGVRRGELAAPDPAFAATFLFDALVAETRNQVLNGRRPRGTKHDRRAYLERVLELLITGLAPRRG
ncbi:MAG: TetR/AcrR family transcriptional regulator [Pseudomonadota bacterium]